MFERVNGGGRVCLGVGGGGLGGETRDLAINHHGATAKGVFDFFPLLSAGDGMARASRRPLLDCHGSRGLRRPPPPQGGRHLRRTKEELHGMG
jgi:hypothetical protein